MNKKCCTCKKFYSLDSFRKDSSRKDGLNPRCQECAAKSDAKYYRAHKEQKTEYDVKYREQNKEKIKERDFLYRQKNKEKIAKRGARHCRNNKKKKAENSARYLQNNKERVYIRNAKRRAIKFNQTTPNADLRIIQLYYAVCGETNEILGDIFFHVDHIQPISKGGLHHGDNLQILEASLNIQKKDRWPLSDDEQLKYRGVTL